MPNQFCMYSDHTASFLERRFAQRGYSKISSKLYGTLEARVQLALERFVIVITSTTPRIYTQITLPQIK